MQAPIPIGSLKDLADIAAHEALRALPTQIVSDFGAWAATVRGANAYPLANQRACDNFKALQPDWDETEIAAAGRRRWQNIGRLMTEYSVLHRITPEHRVTVRDLENFDHVRSNGGAAVLVALHLGNWEVFAPLLQSMGVKVKTFYEPPESRARAWIAERVRRQLSIGLLPLGRAGVRPALRALRQGTCVSIFGDEVVNGVVRGPFFGRPINLSGNMAYAVRLAQLAGTPVIPGYLLRVGKCRFEAVCLPPIWPGDAHDANALPSAVQKLNATLEPIVRANLDQWYFLHDALIAESAAEAAEARA